MLARVGISCLSPKAKKKKEVCKTVCDRKGRNNRFGMNLRNVMNVVRLIADCIMLHLITMYEIFLSVSVTHCFANLFLFLRLGTQTFYSIARASTKDLYEKR